MDQHKSGQVVSLSALVMSSYWIARNGDPIYVESCDHDYTARQLGFTGAHEMELKGFIHLSTFAMGYVVLKDGFQPTNDQYYTMTRLQDVASEMIASTDSSMAYRVYNACAMFFEEVNASASTEVSADDIDFYFPLAD